MRKLIAITEAESAVMQVLWERPLTAPNEILERLKRERAWREPTIRTLVNRLLKKGAIKAERDGRNTLYRPLLSRADFVSSQSSQLIEQLFEGRVAPLVAHFSERGELSKRDLAELKKLIEELGDGD